MFWLLISNFWRFIFYFCYVRSFCCSPGKVAGPSTMPAMNWGKDAVGSPRFICGKGLILLLQRPFLLSNCRGEKGCPQIIQLPISSCKTESKERAQKNCGKRKITNCWKTYNDLGWRKIFLGIWSWWWQESVAHYKGLSNVKLTCSYHLVVKINSFCKMPFRGLSTDICKRIEFLFLSSLEKRALLRTRLKLWPNLNLWQMRKGFPQSWSNIVCVSEATRILKYKPMYKCLDTESKISNTYIRI